MADRQRTAVFAAVYAALWAAHDLGDHVVQTDHQAAGKATDWRCMAGHVGSYTATQLGALAAVSAVTRTRLTCKATIVGILFSALSHAFLDRRWPVVGLLRRTGSTRFADPTVQVDVRGSAVPSDLRSRSAVVAGNGVGPLPLHGPYLADQALHHFCVLGAALIIAAGRRG